MAALQKWNPRVVVEWMHLEIDSPGRYMLNYVFWAFKPCIEGYRYCRDVISVDGTHLYMKYKHKMLVAVTLDANQQVLPLAFALVDEESLASWRWFLRMLSKYLLPSEDDRDLCWRAGAKDNPRKFDRIMEEIKSLNEEAYDWLGRIDKDQWTLAHDGGWRTGILTTNMSECINGVLKGARRLPIVAILQITLSRSVQYFLQRSTRCNRMINANQQWADFAFKLFEVRQAEAVRHIVQKFDYNQQFASEVTLSLTGQGSRTYVVKLKHRMCSCGKWGANGIPCSHAIQACRHFGVNASNFIPNYYSVQSYKKTYQWRFEPVYGEEYWDPMDFELVHNPAVRARRDPGRQVSTRIQNEMDRPQVRARQQYQSRQDRG
ncbi:uncharacterized protein LOC110012151 [Sesamum indicum]|uniref:Uncharacterized protein LOC110012151 n=1 Tax=Sesamum indicum TaxID=4182 RepID=A0A8M8UU29_SESIN|nr:uncharacterized protein LOC110012151 [Sesamum indicum]